VSDARLGKGYLIQRGNGGGPEVFTTIAELLDVDGPEMSVDSVEATHQQSPNYWREFIPGLIDGGEVSFDLNHNPDNATQDATVGLAADLKNRTVRNFKVVFPSPSSKEWTFPAFVTEFSPAGPVADRQTASVTLKVSGEPTLV